MRRKFLFTFAIALLLMLGWSALATAYVGKTTSSAKIYSKTSTSSSVVTSVKDGQYITVYSVSDGWAKVKYDGDTGYMKSSCVTKSSRSYYVKSGYVVLYKSYSTSSKKLYTIGYGTKVTLYATNDGWAQVKYDDTTCYCKASSLSTTNPNGDGKTVYPAKSTATMYAYPSTSAGTKTIKYTTSLTYYCTYDSTWCRVKTGSTYGYIKKSELSTTKYDGYSTASPASGQSKEMDWFKSSISSIFGRGTTAVVTDVKTGISWKVKRTGGLYHVDAEPLTTDDTRAMKKACGSDYGTWHRRAVWISIGGKKYAASMNCMPHGSCQISNNGFDGVFCIHFTNSKTHCSEKVDADHQACIKAALKAG